VLNLIELIIIWEDSTVVIVEQGTTVDNTAAAGRR
jgi:hypothetical protein